VRQQRTRLRGRLTDALAATGATIGFDATGGGRLGGQILACMEAALLRKSTEYNRYGTSTLKQVYLYGSLDMGPTEFRRNFGMAWAHGRLAAVPLPRPHRRAEPRRRSSSAWPTS
jgi:hypothetical protein